MCSHLSHEGWLKIHFFGYPMDNRQHRTWQKKLNCEKGSLKHLVSVHRETSPVYISLLINPWLSVQKSGFSQEFLPACESIPTVPPVEIGLNVFLRNFYTHTRTQAQLLASHWVHDKSDGFSIHALFGRSLERLLLWVCRGWVESW